MFIDLVISSFICVFNTQVTALARMEALAIFPRGRKSGYLFWQNENDT